MLKDIAPKPATGTVAMVRRQRRNMSLPEVLLWNHLKGQPQGVKFRRQHPSGRLGMDFYCADARLVIEVDGFAHDTGDRPARDEKRNAWLRSRGLDTLRVPASEVLNDAAAVAESIVNLARSRLPLHHPAFAGRSPSPRQAGGGFGED